ncbi:alpha/beta hydrolase [Gimesia maris]|uniref:alpha/beta hydrolase n=1 Tax=Gimesia maris TaxID=122 RepID=UPI0032EF0FEF
MRLSYQLVWGLLFLLVGCASLGPLSPLVPVERALVYQPRPFPESDSLPENLPFEDAWFEAEDGTRLHGWFLGHPKPRAVALFCHGNAGNIVSRGETLKILQERHGLAIMTFDYRGYGKSEGKPSERGILQDARAARAWLASRAGVEETEIVLMGRSLGGAVAVDLAAQDGARGLVLASTFSSLPDAAAHHMPWIFPSLNMTQRLNSAGKIGNYSGPLLQSHGDKDQLIPIELGRKLFDAAGGPKQFIVIPGAGHNDPQPEEYRRVFDEFIASLPPAGTQ